MALANPFAGLAEGAGNLFNNKLFLQYLSSAGQDILAGNPIGENVNAVTQQNISAQNYIKLLQKMLGGDIPRDGKVTMDEKGTKFEVPKSALSTPKDESLDLAIQGSNLPGGSGIDWARIGNPFASSQPGEISGADLAGLTTQDISQALQFKMTKEELAQKKITDFVDNLYKIGQLQEIQKGDDLDQPYPIPVPGIGIVTLRQWQTLPTEHKEYALAAAQAAKLGDTEFMSMREWKSLEPTDREQFLRSALKDPELMKAAKELATAGATRISLGEKLEEKKALAAIEGQNYFKNPKWIDDVSKHLESESTQRILDLVPGKGEEYTKNVKRARAEESIKYIEAKIVGGGGTIEDVQWGPDKKTMIWTVKWPSGDTEKIRYGIRS